jgi:glutathione S-transferase
MFESAAICLQLADLYPEAGLIPPPGSPDRALAYQWVVFGMTELDAPLYRWIRDLSRGASESPERDRFADAANALESALGEGEWLLGRQFTVADVICASGSTRGPWAAAASAVRRSSSRRSSLRRARRH